MQRYFSKEKVDSHFILSEFDIHHIKNVMRMKENDLIEVVYNKKTYLCSIDNKYKVNIIKCLEEDNELDIDIILGISLVQEQKLDLILQKATELGVKTIIPVIMQRCVSKIDNKTFKKKQVRWQTICKEASEQSKRNIIPKVEELMTLNDLIKVDANVKLVCSTNCQKKLNITRQDNKKCDKIIIVVGPEGGIAPFEEDILVENGFEKVSLGPRILRVETAVIYALSILNYNFMR